jgi:hypothetical protein
MNIQRKDYIWAIFPGPLTIKGIEVRIKGNRAKIQRGRAEESKGIRRAIAVMAFDDNRVAPGQIINTNGKSSS